MYYPTDLTDDQWKVIEPYVTGGKKYNVSIRSVINAIRYVVKTGCQWSMLPGSFPPRSTVYYHLRRLSERGIMEQILAKLIAIIRVKAGKDPAPSAAVLDAQSVKSTQVTPKAICGYDGGKKIKGIKRHLVTDTMGLPLAISISAASVGDRGGAIPLLDKLSDSYKQIRMVFCDGGYSWVGRSDEPIQRIGKHTVTIVKRNKEEPFKVLAKRWVVERTFAWIETDRRNAKCYERSLKTAKAITEVTLIRKLLTRLCRPL